MNRELVDKVVNAVLYEGYILYPYRASSKKNQRERFTFGRIYPEAYSIVQEGREPCAMQTQCLIRDESKDAQLHIEVRFLHPMAREIGALTEPLDELPNESPFEIVPELRVDDKVYRTWHEAVERQIVIPHFSLGKPISQANDFHFAGSRTTEPIRNADGKIAAVVVRRQDAIKAKIEIATETVDDVVTKLTVRILNQTEILPSDLEDQDKVVMRTMASTHTIIWAEGGECISLLDPPGEYVKAAAECKNIGTWPVLVGDQTKHERDAMLSSPIILYDYPKIASESAGDLFDGTEIDEILTLRVMTMTDEEKAEMRDVDEHARRILERTETLPKDHLLQMHGTMRDLRQASEDFFNPKGQRRAVIVNGVELKAGDRVRIHPKKRADVFDIALSGKIAIIEAIEEDVQNEVHLALVLEDDPGRELGMARQPGHRFFYGVDEIEPV
jgi:hydrogenase maturation protease